MDQWHVGNEAVNACEDFHRLEFNGTAFSSDWNVQSVAPSRRAFLKSSAAFLLAAAFHRIAGAAGTAAPPRTIHPYPNRVAWGAGTMRLDRRVELVVGVGTPPDVLAMMKETWRQFTLDEVRLDVAVDTSLPSGPFALAGGRPPERHANDAYALVCGTSGIAASAAGSAAMRHAWFTLLQLLQADDDLGFNVPHVEIHDSPALRFRGLHVCVFHETTPRMIEKAIRLAAFYKFSHVVLEFWGMLRLDALKELSWPEAWSKADARRLVTIARTMGLEVVPMFNSWGHATACRIKHGRHVVLDQNPRLAPLFEPDGWTWCLSNPRTQALLRSVADELIEFTGPGAFFHIGCDEAYSHATCDRCRRADRTRLLVDHVNGLAEHLEKRGRRAIMWGDALLGEVSRKIMIADWHYDVTQGDVPTLARFRERGYETLACPWNSPANIRTLAKAAAANNSGFLMTTWHHLAQSIPTLAWAAGCAWSQDQAALGMRQMDWSLMRAATASHLRKLVPADGKFERAGWNSFEQPAETD